MKGGFEGRALCVAALFAVGCGPSETAAPKQVSAPKDAERAGLLVAELVRMSSSGPTEEDSRRNSVYLDHYGSLDSCGSPRLNLLMKVEEDLLAVGTAAFPAMAAAAADPKTHPVLRKGLVDLMARMELGQGEVETLLRLADKDPIVQVRIACVEAIALQRSDRWIPALGGLLKVPSKFPPHIVHWALEVAGSESSSGKFLDHVESVLAAEELESPLSDLGVVKGELPQEFAHLLLLAKVTEANKWLADDIWRAGQLRSKRAVGVLIKSLHFHARDVQHMALHFLRKSIEAGPALKAVHDSQIHSLEVAREWSSWWTQSEAILQLGPGGKWQVDPVKGR